MSDVIEDIKRYQPASLKVTLGDGTEKPVAVPKNRNRWSRTQQVLDALPWVRIECLDGKGMVLGVIDDDEQVVALAGDTTDEGSIAMARVLVDVMRSTMKETRAMFEAQMRGTADLVSALIEGQRSLQQSYELSMQVQRAALLTQAGEQAGGNPEILQMLQLAVGLTANKAPVASKPVAIQGGKQP